VVAVEDEANDDVEKSGLLANLSLLVSVVVKGETTAGKRRLLS
jgi:hypothetical protein